MGAGRKKVVETEEFQDAVAAAVAKELATFKADLLSAAEKPGQKDGGVSDLLGEVLSKLTVNLQAVNNQGQHNKPLSPEEIVRREAAHNRMIDLLTAAREPGAMKPAYKLISKTCLNERFLEPFKIVDKKAVNNEITWTGVPNDSMVPINEAAEAIFNAWRAVTGGQTSLIPTADNRPLHVTAAGLTVRGEPPKRQHVAAIENFADDLGYANGDPNAPEVAVLGTVMKKAKQNSVAGVS